MLAELGRGGHQQRPQRIGGLSASLDGRDPGHPQRAHHLHQVVAALGNGPGLPGQHSSCRGLGIQRVRLAAPPASLAVGPVDLQHHLTMAIQQPGQRGPIAASALNTPGLHLSNGLGPGQQSPIPDRCGGNSNRGELAAQEINGAGHMDIAVGVDADDDPGRLWLCDCGDGRLPSGQGSMAAPAERADNTATSLWRQAPVRSRSLGWCSPEQSPRPGSTAHGKGTRPVKQRVRPGPQQPTHHRSEIKTGISETPGPFGLPRSMPGLTWPR